MASERTYPLPVTIQATETGAKDQTYTVNLHPDTTTSELIQSLVPSLFGPDVNADLFMLFEAEVAIGQPNLVVIIQKSLLTLQYFQLCRRSRRSPTVRLNIHTLSPPQTTTHT